MSENVAGESQPADDLRSTLAAALAEHDQPESLVVKAEPKEAPTAEIETEAEPSEAAPEEKADTRARTPDGKFAAKEAAEPDADAAAEPEAVAEPKKSEGLEPPVNWKTEDKEVFKKLPPDAQKILVARQKDMDADYTRKTQAIAAIKNEWEPVAKIFEPYQDVMKQKGFTPRSLIESWANVEKRLAENPLEVITGLVRGYRVPPDQVAAALGIRAAPPAEGEVPTATLPPEFQSIQARQEALERQIAEDRRQREEERRTQFEAAQAERLKSVSSTLEQFKSSKDEKGNLLYPHYDELDPIMARDVTIAKANGQPIPPLKELYENAAWAHPSTREKLLTARAQQEEQKRNDEARAKAAAAKKAASSVTGAPGAGQSPQSGARAEKSLREQLEEATADAMSA